MTYQTIDYQVQSRVAWVTLNRPHSLNALTRQMLEELSDVMDKVLAAGADGVRVLVITGQGRAFCAGADLQAVAAKNTQTKTSMPEAIQQVLGRLRKLPLPVIAVINGIAMGGGLELAMHCDILLASETAKIADAHANVGVLPGAGGATLLPRLVGPVFAKYMVFSGEPVPAIELQRVGLVAKVFAPSELITGARELAERLAQKSPLGLARMKRLIDDGLEQANLDTALSMELMANALHAHSHDYEEGLRAFHERRAPNFLGH